MADALGIAFYSKTLAEQNLPLRCCHLQLLFDDCMFLDFIFG
jgi:hypothetical protein